MIDEDQWDGEDDLDMDVHYDMYSDSHYFGGLDLTRTVDVITALRDVTDLRDDDGTPARDDQFDYLRVAYQLELLYHFGRLKQYTPTPAEIRLARDLMLRGLSQWRTPMQRLRMWAVCHLDHLSRGEQIPASIEYLAEEQQR